MVSRFVDAGYAGVVDQNIDVSEFIADLFEDFLYFVFAGDIEMPEFCDASIFGDCLCDLFALFIEDIRDGDFRTLPSENLAG